MARNRVSANLFRMDERITTRDLLDAWRDATRAAELAERLAQAATTAAEAADQSAEAAEEIAGLAEAAAAAADHAAASARNAALKARSIAADSRGVDLNAAEGVVEVARAVETAARDRYQRAVSTAERRHIVTEPGERTTGAPGAGTEHSPERDDPRGDARGERYRWGEAAEQ